MYLFYFSPLFVILVVEIIMKAEGTFMARILAVIALFIPGGLAVYGIKLMRDTVFNEFNSIFFTTEIQFIVGLLLFVGGTAFLGGFVVFRDKKKERLKGQNNESLKDG